MVVWWSAGRGATTPPSGEIFKHFRGVWLAQIFATRQFSQMLVVGLLIVDLRACSTRQCSLAYKHG
jgi:hypothetical protein